MLPNLKTGAVEQCRSFKFGFNLVSSLQAYCTQMPICYDSRKARPEGRRGLCFSLNGVQKCNWPRFVCSRQTGSSSVSRSKFSISSHYTAPMNNCVFGLWFERWKWWASFIFPPPSGSQSELKVSPALPTQRLTSTDTPFSGASSHECRSELEGKPSDPNTAGWRTVHTAQLACPVLQLMKHGQLLSWCFPSTK